MDTYSSSPIVARTWQQDPNHGLCGEALVRALFPYAAKEFSFSQSGFGLFPR